MRVPVSIWRCNFNPLSPHGERPRLCCRRGHAVPFQSTLPAWGETRARQIGAPEVRYFNPLSPHGERRYPSVHMPKEAANFNPLSPHGERLEMDTKAGSLTVFQSTLPAWGETCGRLLPDTPGNISIHSPRMGRDRYRGRQGSHGE